jgi:hypothetical protein
LGFFEVFRRIFGGKYVLLCLNSPCRENPENVMKKSACFLLIRPLAGDKKNEGAAHPDAGQKKNEVPAIKKNE